MGVQFTSVLSPSHGDPMDCSTPGLLVPYHLPEFSQVHVHWLSDTIQLSYPLSPSSPSAFHLSHHQSFPMSQLFTSGDQNIGASASVLSTSIQGWFTLRLTGLIFSLSKGLTRVFSSTTVPRHQFFVILPSLRSGIHSRIWPLERP